MIGLLGGTFDPIHFAHLRLAEEAREQMGLTQVRFIPSAAPPHRPPPVASAADRAQMVSLAIADAPAFAIDRTELDHPDEPGYTVATLTRLRAQFGPQLPLIWLVGADAFAQLTTWHRWSELLLFAHLAVATRPGTALDPATLPAPLVQLWQERRRAAPLPPTAPPAGWVIELPMVPLAISATAIRALLGAGHSARYLLPDPVLGYIAHHRLYQPPKDHSGN
jgi:nicotinate-nucleotide adenylyltransferase